MGFPSFRADIQNKGGTLDINVYDVIGESWDGEGLTAKSVADAVAGAKGISRINLFINSQGGSVFDAVAIYNILNRHKARKVVHIDGAAISAASVLAMVGDEINIAENALLMVHDPWSMTVGDAAELRKTAELLDATKKTIVDTYASRTGNTAEQVSQWMSAETWMTADEAVERHFATAKTPTKAVLNAIDLSRFTNVPKWVANMATPAKITRDWCEKNAVAIDRGLKNGADKWVDLIHLKDGRVFSATAFTDDATVQEITTKHAKTILAQNDLDEHGNKVADQAPEPGPVIPEWQDAVAHFQSQGMSEPEARKAAFEAFPQAYEKWRESCGTRRVNK